MSSESIKTVNTLSAPLDFSILLDASGQRVTKTSMEISKICQEWVISSHKALCLVYILETTSFFKMIFQNVLGWNQIE